jgi:nucleoside-diphosphate-sugar epimerase
MKILITGGSGFVARNLARLLSSNGYEVLAPSHSELDMCNAGKVFTFLMANHPVDAIIHAAFNCKKEQENKYEDFVNNIKMFESIVQCDLVGNVNRPVIILGSGAEMDRRYEIDNANEAELFENWPLDLYGLSKNIIARRAQEELEHPYVLRLFGCFGEDEENTRFIKRSILRIKEGLPIEINQNRTMDFFYIEDVFRVIDEILKNGGNSDINLVYDDKYDLVILGKKIYEEAGVSNLPIKLKSLDIGRSYTGDGTYLRCTNINLLGLDEGIKRMVKALL